MKSQARAFPHSASRRLHAFSGCPFRKRSVRAENLGSDDATNIGLGEIIALEQEWLARRTGQRVGVSTLFDGAAVTEIDGCPA
jgi:hypothetical protein